MTPVGVDLWGWSIDDDPASPEECKRLLSEDERARARRFKHKRNSQRFVSCRARLRATLARYTGNRPERLDMRQGTRAKPYLAAGPAFNLSHSGSRALLAVTEDRDVALGVDIEQIRPVDDDLEALAFTGAECAALRALAPKAREHAFFLGWTRKEAVLKAVGDGLYTDPRRLAVTLDPSGPARLVGAGAELPAPCRWRLADLSPAPGFVAAVAAVTDGRELSLHQRS